MLLKTKFWKSSDDGFIKSKTSFINNNVGMFSFSKIILILMHLVQQKVDFNQKKWKWCNEPSNSVDLSSIENLWKFSKKGFEADKWPAQNS